VRIELLRPFEASRSLGEGVVEEARDRWVEVEEKYESLRVRAQPGYVVIVSEWASRDEALTSEVVDALTRRLSSRGLRPWWVGP